MNHQKFRFKDIGNMVNELKKNPQATKALRKEFDSFLKKHPDEDIEDILGKTHEDVRRYFDEEGDEDFDHKVTPEGKTNDT
jgi:hypothetical protein